jgi:hypothetical protein
MINRKLRYLVKWKDFGLEHNSWEPWDNVHAPDLVAEFYRRHPGAARHIRSIDFHTIPFQSNPRVSGRHPFERGVVVRGLSYSDVTRGLSYSDVASSRRIKAERKLYTPPPYG